MSFSGTAPDRLETDYLVVGAGASGMAFVDALVNNADVDVVMIDRRHAPGGHWLDGYPFLRLHQPSAMYGVNSTHLGHDRITPDGTDRGFYERASAAEIAGYYDDVLRHQFLESGRVRFFPMSEYEGGRRFQSRVTGRVTDVDVRRAVVDATYIASSVPGASSPPFAIADGAWCVPVGGLATLTEHPSNYVIIGGGKTSLDAICWLLDQGTDPDAITWIRPRDAWVLNRAFFQPRASSLETFRGIVLELEALAASDTVDEVYERFEESRVVLRTDPNVWPTMMKGGTISEGELAQLQTIRNVVRLGHVQRIERDQIVLDEGSVPTCPEHVHVHCASYGLGRKPPRLIFTDDTITVQTVTRVGVTLSAALIGFLESTGRSADEKNRLCRPNTLMDTPFDYLRVFLAGISTEMEWGDAPDLRNWMDDARLNLMHGLPEYADPDELRELQGRFLNAVGPALAKVDEFAAGATPAERERIFVPEDAPV